jgi:hypothetical protein
MAQTCPYLRKLRGLSQVNSQQQTPNLDRVSRPIHSFRRNLVEASHRQASPARRNLCFNHNSRAVADEVTVWALALVPSRVSLAISPTFRAVVEAAFLCQVVVDAVNHSSSNKMPTRPWASTRKMQAVRTSGAVVIAAVEEMVAAERTRISLALETVWTLAHLSSNHHLEQVVAKNAVPKMMAKAVLLGEESGREVEADKVVGALHKEELRPARNKGTCGQSWTTASGGYLQHFFSYVS